MVGKVVQTPAYSQASNYTREKATKKQKRSSKAAALQESKQIQTDHSSTLKSLQSRSLTRRDTPVIDQALVMPCLSQATGYSKETETFVDISVQSQSVAQDIASPKSSAIQQKVMADAGESNSVS